MNLGLISSKYESGGLGAGAVSSGAGDPGGASYGTFQLASNTGTLQSFLKASGFGNFFSGLAPGTKQFNSKWKELAQDPSFGDAQQKYIAKTHYDPLRSYADLLGIPETPALNEVLFSMGVQHGKAKSILDRASISPDDSEADIIMKLYDARTKYVTGLDLPSATKQSVINRYKNESQDVLKLSTQSEDQLNQQDLGDFGSIPKLGGDGKPEQKVDLGEFDTIPQMSAEDKAFKDSYESFGGAVMAGITGFNRGVGNIVEGVLQKIIPSGKIQDALTQVHAAGEADYAQAKAEYPKATITGYAAGTIGTAATAAALPGLSTPTAIGAATSGGILGNLAWVDPNHEGFMGSRTFNTVLGAALGAGTYGAVKGATFLKQKWLPTKSSATRTVAEAANEAAPGQVDDILGAANRQGVRVTPGEASGNVPLQVLEQTTPASHAEKMVIGKFLSTREHTLQRKLNSVVENIVKEGDDVAAARADALYKSVDSVQVPSDTTKSLMADPIISKTIGKAAKSDKFLLNEKQAGSIGWFDELKKYFDDVIGKERLAGGTTRRYEEARSLLVSELDKVSPDYAVAREVSQRIIQKRVIKEAFSKMNLGALKHEPGVQTIYTKLFNTQTKRESFLKTIESSGGNTAQVKDLISIMSAIDKTKVDALLKQSPNSSLRFTGGVSSKGSLFGRVGESMAGIIDTRFDDQVIKLMVDPNWAAKLATVKAITNPALKTRAFSNILIELSTQPEEGVLPPLKGSD